MTESELWARIDDACRGLGGWHGQRHEDKINPDIPDASFTWRGLSGWVELKSSDTVGVKPTPIPKLRPGQLNWLKKEAACGGVAWIIWAVRGGLLVVPAAEMGEFNEKRTMDDWIELSDGFCATDHISLRNEMLRLLTRESDNRRKT